MTKKRRRTLAIVAAVLLLLGILAVRRDIPREALLGKYAGPTSHFADIEGMPVHYRDEGSGPPIVLLHGTTSSLHTWDAWTARLSPRRRVVRLDLAGYGLTGPAPDRDYSAVRQARLVTTLMDRLGIARADVVGNSYGGRIALTMTLESPARVRRLVLVDAAGLSGQRRPGTFRLARTPIVGDVMTVVTPRFVVKKNVLEVYGEPSKVTDALVDRYDDLVLREGNRRALVDRMRAPFDPDLDGRLAEIRAPVLVIWGARDAWIPRSFADRFGAGIAGAKVVVHETAGHVPMEEDPDATLRDAEAFFEATDAHAAL